MVVVAVVVVVMVMVVQSLSCVLDDGQFTFGYG